jgi:phosphoenolpyruvate carboxylase
MPALPGVAASLAHRNADEPYRQAVTLMRERVRAIWQGGPSRYLDATGADRRPSDHRDIAGGAGRALRPWRRSSRRDPACRDLRLPLATLDIRDHSSRHETALAAVFRLTDVEPDYAALDEGAKLALLEREIANPRPLVPFHLDELDDEPRRFWRHSG